MAGEEQNSSRALKQIVGLALAEDLGDKGDVTSAAIFSPGDMGAARVLVAEACTISGLEAAREVCRQVDPLMAWLPLVMDGQAVPAGAEIARLEGKLVSIMAAERTLLNFLSRLSGIASLASEFVAAVAGFPTRVAATRKTDPGMRHLEKQAVVDGGGESHRLGLYDAVLIKDNHITVAGGVGAAVAAVRRSLGEGTEIEVEVDTEAQLQEAIEAGAARVLVDNMTPEQVRSCVKLAGGRVIVEASGGIGLSQARMYAEAGADVISAGVITRSASGIDFSLEVEA